MWWQTMTSATIALQRQPRSQGSLFTTNGGREERTWERRCYRGSCFTGALQDSSTPTTKNGHDPTKTMINYQVILLKWFQMSISKFRIPSILSRIIEMQCEFIKYKMRIIWHFIMFYTTLKLRESLNIFKNQTKQDKVFLENRHLFRCF